MNHPNRSNLLSAIYRQGDVLLRAINRIPAKARELRRKNDRIVVALGEMTGHEHAFRDKGICSLAMFDKDEVEFLLVGAGGATLRHEFADGRKAEHDAINIPEGKYELADQVQYTPAELVRVTD